MVNIGVKRTVVVWQVLQVYLSWMKSAVPVPRWTLVGFHRVTLHVNSPQQFNFTITARQMAVWINDATGFSVTAGTHQLQCDRIGVQLPVWEIYLSLTSHPDQLSLAIPPWVGTMSTGQRVVMLCG